MPELPEVEIIKLGLQKKIIGLKIQKIQVLPPKSFLGNPNLAQGQIVLKVWRKAKILGVDLGTSFWGEKRHQNQSEQDSGQVCSPQSGPRMTRKLPSPRSVPMLDLGNK